MQTDTFKRIFVTVALLLVTSVSNAAEQKTVAASAPLAPAKPSVPAAKKVENKPATVAKIRLVDINSAGRNELKTLPDVTDPIADKIIAGRPFGSKSQLATRGILPRDVYENLKGLIVAKQNANTTAKLLGK